MGENLTEIHPVGRRPENGKISKKMGIARSDDSGKYFLKSNDSGKCFSENSRKVVKLEKWKSIVIVAVGNLSEIRPLLTPPKKWQNSKKWGSSEVMIQGNTFSKVMIMENTFQKILVKS